MKKELSCTSIYTFDKLLAVNNRYAYKKKDTHKYNDFRGIPIEEDRFYMNERHVSGVMSKIPN